jgi:hypothetical protein
VGLTLDALYAVVPELVSAIEGINAVDLTSDQSIGGEKTFTGSVKVPTPLDDGDAVNKEYADKKYFHSEYWKFDSDYNVAHNGAASYNLHFNINKDSFIIDDVLKLQYDISSQHEIIISLIPECNADIKNLGSDLQPWTNLWLSGTLKTNTIRALNSDISIGAGPNGAINFENDVWQKGTLYPYKSNTYDIGAFAYQIRDIYLAHNLTDGINFITVSAMVNKLDKITSTSDKLRVYAITPAGTQITKKVSINAVEDTLVERSTGGVVRCGTPVGDNDATTKKYVDSKISVRDNGDNTVDITIN